MKELSFYEQVGILLPGAVLLFGLVLLAPELRTAVSAEGVVTVGGLGLFLILAYALGHLVAAVGNILEGVLWRLVGGMPASWVRDPKRARLLTADQHQALLTKVRKRADAEVTTIRGLSPAQWRGLFSGIYRDVLVHESSGRLEVMLGNYGLNRGLASASLVLLATTLVRQPPEWRLYAAGLALAVAGYGFRMVRFALYWAREVYAAYLALPDHRTEPPVKRVAKAV
jgi:hypothetical protein